MTLSNTFARRLLGVVTAGALIGAALVGAAAPALADTRPIDAPNNPVTVSADALPTVQIDGVAWSQVVVGNTVYVGGKFTTARPAGAAAGSRTPTPRSNLLAYDITTGNLITTFAPDLQRQVAGDHGVARRHADLRRRRRSPRPTADPLPHRRVQTPPPARSSATFEPPVRRPGARASSRPTPPSTSAALTTVGNGGARTRATSPPSTPPTARCSPGHPTPLTARSTRWR